MNEARKPFELNTFNIWAYPGGVLYADVPSERWPVRVDYEVQRKRLTDAELAAEWHSIERMSWGDTELEQRAATVYRFATLPHHDEARA